MTRARDNADFGHIAGQPNLIINGDFRVNQRGGTRTPGVGIYGYDRWKGHASGLEQVVEALNISAGTYTLSWAGGGTGSLDGSAAAAGPITVDLAGGTNVSVVVPSNATEVQLEPGDKASPFKLRDMGQELLLCERYYEKSYNAEVAPGTVNNYSGAIYHGPLTAAAAHYIAVRYQVKKRASAVFTIWNPQTGDMGSAYFSNGSSIGPNSIYGAGSQGASPRWDVGASGLSIFMQYTAESEL